MFLVFLFSWCLVLSLSFFEESVVLEHFGNDWDCFRYVKPTNWRLLVYIESGKDSLKSASLPATPCLLPEEKGQAAKGGIE